MALRLHIARLKYKLPNCHGKDGILEKYHSVPKALLPPLVDFLYLQVGYGVEFNLDPAAELLMLILGIEIAGSKNAGCQNDENQQENAARAITGIIMYSLPRQPDLDSGSQQKGIPREKKASEVAIAGGMIAVS